MGTFGWTHWLIVALLALLLFGGRGKISEIMGDFAKGIKSFKKGMAEEDETAKKPDAPKPIEHTAAKPGEQTTGAGTTSKAG